MRGARFVLNIGFSHESGVLLSSNNQSTPTNQSVSEVSVSMAMLHSNFVGAFEVLDLQRLHAT